MVNVHKSKTWHNWCYCKESILRMMNLPKYRTWYSWHRYYYKEITFIKANLHKYNTWCSRSWNYAVVSYYFCFQTYFFTEHCWYGSCVIAMSWLNRDPLSSDAGSCNRYPSRDETDHHEQTMLTEGRVTNFDKTKLHHGQKEIRESDIHFGYSIPSAWQQWDVYIRVHIYIYIYTKSVI
jgi:hypothetical protein